MKIAIAIVLLSFVALSLVQEVFTQGFGEYGRAVGSVPRGPAVTPRGRGDRVQGQVDSGGGVGDLSPRALPARLVVVSKETGLFPRQDAELKKITQLSQGEKLVPLVQSEGNDPWYMVKTEKGLIGWVKSSDVRRQDPEKK